MYYATHVAAQKKRRTSDAPGTGNHECHFRPWEPRVRGGNSQPHDQPTELFVGSRHANEVRKERPCKAPTRRAPLYLLGHNSARRRKAECASAICPDVLRRIAATHDDRAPQRRNLERRRSE